MAADLSSAGKLAGGAGPPQRLKPIDRKAKQTTKSNPKAKTRIYRMITLERNEKRAKLLDWLQAKVTHYFTQFASTYLFIYTENSLWH